MTSRLVGFSLAVLSFGLAAASACIPQRNVLPGSAEIVVMLGIVFALGVLLLASERPVRNLMAALLLFMLAHEAVDAWRLRADVDTVAQAVMGARL